MRSYSLNAESAKKATEGGRIEKTGAYTCTVVRCEFITAKSGAQGLEFEVKTSNGEMGQFSLYTHNASGGEIFGLNQVNAIMVCAKVRQLTENKTVVKKYDYDAKERVDTQVMCANELHGKALQFILQRENYTGNDGSEKFRMTFGHVASQEGFTADEVLSRTTTPVRFAELAMGARDKVANQKGAAKPVQQQAVAEMVDLDDALPF